jgi:hypothetical protein
LTEEKRRGGEGRREKRRGEGRREKRREYHK